MTWPKTLTLLALLIGFVATFYWIQGTMQVSPKIIDELSATKLDSNPDVVMSLSAQKADATVAFCLLLIALVLQLVALFVSESLVIARQHSNRILVFWVTIILMLLVVVALAHMGNKYLFKITKHAVENHFIIERTEIKTNQ